MPRGWKYRPQQRSGPAVVNRAEVYMVPPDKPEQQGTVKRVVTKKIKKKTKVVKQTTTAKAKNKKTPKRAKKAVWDYAWLQGKPREEVMRLTEEMEEDFRQLKTPYFTVSHLGETVIPDPPSKEWLESGLEVLVQWAQLGEGELCEKLAKTIVDAYPDHFHAVKVYRRVLHAHINEFKSITFIHKTRRPNFALSNNELDEARGVLRRADAVLQRMESASRSYVEEFQKRGDQTVQSKTILDGTDYRDLVMSHCHVGNTVEALRSLRQAEVYFNDSGHLARLAPSTQLYTAIARAILSAPKKQFYERFGTKYSPIEKVNLLCKGYIGYTRQYPELMKPSLLLYNIVLDGWSKAIPQPSKKEAKVKLSQYAKDDAKKEKVAEQVSALWASMQWDKVTPDTKAYTSMIYTYSKTDYLEKAYEMFEGLAGVLLSVPAAATDKNRLPMVDSRSFRLLANAMSKQTEKESELETRETLATNLGAIIDAMWRFDQAGYDDAAPDIFLYSTALKAWANTKSSKSIEQAEMLVEDLKQRAKQHPKKNNLKPDTAVYNALLHVIATQPGIDDAAERAGSIIKKLEESDSVVKPDVISYNSLIEACLTTRDGVEKAVQTLDRMIEKRNPRPDEYSFRLVITALIEADIGKPEVAERFLDRMEERFTPPVVLYEKLTLAWCNQLGQTVRAQKLLERMEQLHDAANPYGLSRESFKPKRSLYNEVINACKKQGLADTAEAVRAKRDAMYSGEVLTSKKFKSNDQIFELVDKIDSEITYDDRPVATTANFNTVLGLLASSRKIWAGQRAEDILNYMLELTLKRNNREIKPNIVTINSVMAAWAKSGHPNASEGAAGILSKLEQLQAMGVLEDIRPDRITYNTLIAAHAKSDAPDSARKAQQVFDQLYRMGEEGQGEEDLTPDIVSYSTLLNAWSTSDEVDAAKNAEEIVREMHNNHKNDSSKPKPNTVCFNEVLYAWARSQDRGAAERAELFFKLMEDMDDEDGKPDLRTYNIVLLALANSPNVNSAKRALEFLEGMKQGEIKPDSVSYNTVISAFTKKGGAENVASAMEILEKAIESQDVELGSKFFSTVLYTISDSNEPNRSGLGEEVFELVKRNIADGKLRFTLDAQFFNALINCWNRSDEAIASQRIDALLSEMLQLAASSNPGAAPDVVTYTSAIDTIAKSGEIDAPLKAEAQLDSMEVKPNAHTYTSVIKSYARSNYHDKARRAQKILDRMKKDYQNGNHDAKPTIVSYNAVLNAAEFSSGSHFDVEEAFKVACVTFDEIRASPTLKPDHVTYGTFLGVINELMPKSSVRNDMIQLVFRRCCVDGMLGSVVMKKFREAASPPLYMTLMGRVVADSLPPEWTCNVRE